MNSAWDIDEITRQSLLYDFYGQLLTKRQQQVMELYHGENFSLAEIAEEFGISRQGVYDLVHRCEKQLDLYEEKLHMMNRLLTVRQQVKEMHKLLVDSMENGLAPDPDRLLQMTEALLEDL